MSVFEDKEKKLLEIQSKCTVNNLTLGNVTETVDGVLVFIVFLKLDLFTSLCAWDNFEYVRKV